MKRIEIKLDNVPAINDIAKEWKRVFSGAPKGLKKILELDYYGGLIFANAILKGKKVGIREEKFKTASEEDYAIPGMAEAISNKYICVFEILADNPDDILEAEVFLIFSDDKKIIQRLLFLNHTHQVYNWSKDISEIISFLDCSASLHLVEEYMSNEYI